MLQVLDQRLQSADQVGLGPVRHRLPGHRPVQEQTIRTQVHLQVRDSQAQALETPSQRKASDGVDEPVHALLRQFHQIVQGLELRLFAHGVHQRTRAVRCHSHYRDPDARPVEVLRRHHALVPVENAQQEHHLPRSEALECHGVGGRLPQDDRYGHLQETGVKERYWGQPEDFYHHRHSELHGSRDYFRQGVLDLG